jgi:hypothetical protein
MVALLTESGSPPVARWERSGGSAGDGDALDPAGAWAFRVVPEPATDDGGVETPGEVAAADDGAEADVSDGSLRASPATPPTGAEDEGSLAENDFSPGFSAGAAADGSAVASCAASGDEADDADGAPGIAED